MTKKNRDNPLPLFPDMSFKTDDEKQFESKQASKAKARKLIQISPAPITGPACIRCQHWTRPQDAKDFGVCRALGVAESVSPMGGVDKGDVLPRIEAQKIHRISTEPLRTREGFQCSAYQGYGEVAA